MCGFQSIPRSYSPRPTRPNLCYDTRLMKRRGGFGRGDQQSRGRDERRGPPPPREPREPREERPRPERLDPREETAKRLLDGIAAPFEVLYGMNPVRESLLAGRRKARRIFCARREGSPDTQELLKLAKERRVEVVQVEREALDAVVHVSAATEAGGQGIAMAVTPYRYFSLDEVAGAKSEQRRRVLVLDEIEDPRNLGAMARTAEAAGFRGLVVQEHRAAAVTPVAVKASAGAAEHLRIARETNLASSLERLKEQGYWVVGLSGDADAKDIYEVDFDMDVALVVGAEGKGLRARTRSLCDLLVRLPMAGRVGSLNASAACAAAVYQVLRPSAKR